MSNNSSVKTDTRKSPIEDLSTNINFKYALLAGGILASAGIFYAYYKHRT
jgi:hypothetical protein